MQFAEQNFMRVSSKNGGSAETAARAAGDVPQPLLVVPFNFQHCLKTLFVE